MSVVTMPQLGIDDNRPASVSEMPRLACSEGIRKATPLMKRKELAVTPSETITIDQRAPVLSWPVSFGSVGIRPCSHTGPGFPAPLDAARPRHAPSAITRLNRMRLGRIASPDGV